MALKHIDRLSLSSSGPFSGASRVKPPRDDKCGSVLGGAEGGFVLSGFESTCGLCLFFFFLSLTVLL